MTSTEYAGFQKTISEELKNLPDSYIDEANIKLGRYVFGEEKLDFAIGAGLTAQQRTDIRNKISEIVSEAREEYSQSNDYEMEL